jgi:tetratricopeptide (TPR) repeat protein
MRRHLQIPAKALAAVMISACSLGPASANPAPSLSPSTQDSFAALTDRQIALAQELLRSRPDSVVGMNRLAQAYLQKVREVGEPSYYPKVESLLETAIGRDPANFDTTTLTGLLLLAQHRFREALEWGNRARALNPSNSGPLGVITDADVELGLYDDATTAVRQMVDLRPDLASYSRFSYVQELHGNIDGAIQSMRDALTAGGPYPENTAYVQVLLGNLYFNRGRPEEAEAQYRQVLRRYTTYVHALASLGAVRAAQASFHEAIQLYKRAVGIYPLPQYVVALGDVYATSGDAADAARTYDLAAAEQRLYAANGVDLDQELALFDADHQRNLPEALAAARRAITDRPSVTSADVLGWTQYQSGAFPEALSASRRAHRIGTLDAVFFFHTGMIEARLGMADEARTDLRKALSINPHFSVLHAPEARSTLARLGG